MSLALQILAAAALDLLLGDPRRAPHPVRWIGFFLERLEPRARRVFKNERAGGAMAVLVTLPVVLAAVLLVIGVAEALHPAAGDAARVLIIYTTLSARGLADHAMAVHRALASGGIEEARAKVGMIVGRDTAAMDEEGVARAAVESVAENTADGVIAPLFYAALFGPAGAMLYKAVNTMDSMFGSKDSRYAKFGFAAARLDDAVNYIPARLTALLVPLAAWAIGRRGADSVRVALRDGRKHESPNSGWPEAAFAGALGVRLGGDDRYHGDVRSLPVIGDPAPGPGRDSVRGAVVLMYGVFACALFLLLSARAAAAYFLG
ncbi:MAG: adenosylcobinamide-phosphate synthase CbiB [Candidatus Nitrospinota bacterium M3_3B_026]